MSRVVVIGGGVIGLCAGISLRARGVDVTVYDDPTGPPGASAWNCGWLAPSHCHPLPSPESFRRSTRWLLSREAAPLSIRPEPRLARWLLGFAWSSRSGPHARGFAALAELMREALPAWQRLERDGLAIAWTTDGALVPFLDGPAWRPRRTIVDELAALGLAEPRDARPRCGARTAPVAVLGRRRGDRARRRAGPRPGGDTRGAPHALRRARREPGRGAGHRRPCASPGDRRRS